MLVEIRQIGHRWQYADYGHMVRVDKICCTKHPRFGLFDQGKAKLITENWDCKRHLLDLSTNRKLNFSASVQRVIRREPKVECYVLTKVKSPLFVRSFYDNF